MIVPNLGLKDSQVANLVKGRPNEAFINDLLVRSDDEPSHFLSYLARESNLDRRRRLPFEIFSYYKTISSPTIMVSSLGDTLGCTGIQRY